MDGRRPNPRIVLFAKHAQSDAIFGEELHGLIAAGHRDEFAIRKIRNAQRIEAERTLFANTLAAKREERYRLVPIGDAQHIRVANADRTDGDRIDGRIAATRPFDFSLLIAGLIPDRNRPVGQPQCQILAVDGPSATIDARNRFELLYGLLFDRPKCKVRLRARQQLMRDRIECQTLHWIVVAAIQVELVISNHS